MKMFPVITGLVVGLYTFSYSLNYIFQIHAFNSMSVTPKLKYEHQKCTIWKYDSVIKYDTLLFQVFCS